jgi:hypothetical protein
MSQTCTFQAARITAVTRVTLAYWRLSEIGM